MLAQPTKLCACIYITHSTNKQRPPKVSSTHKVMHSYIYVCVCVYAPFWKRIISGSFPPNSPDQSEPLKFDPTATNRTPFKSYNNFSRLIKSQGLGLGDWEDLMEGIHPFPWEAVEKGEGEVSVPAVSSCTSYTPGLTIALRATISPGWATSGSSWQHQQTISA